MKKERGAEGGDQFQASAGEKTGNKPQETGRDTGGYGSEQGPKLALVTCQMQIKI